MNRLDPIEHAERMVRTVHDTAGSYTRPVLSRYPLLFAFLITFSLAAILHGFEVWADKIAFFEEHPGYLMSMGILFLLLTGTLYKLLDKPE